MILIRMFIAASVLLTWSCVSRPVWVRKQFEPRGGIIAYQAAAARHVENLQLANEEASSFCHGPFNVLAEGSETNYAGSTYQPAMGIMPATSTPEFIKLTTIEFKCLNQNSYGSN